MPTGKTQNLLASIAKIISALTCYPVVIVLYFAFAMYIDQAPIVTTVLHIASMMLSLGILYEIYRVHGLIADYDITERKERPRFILAQIFLLFFWLLSAYIFKFDTLFITIFIQIVITIIFFFITIFWKISAHTTTLTAFLVFLYLLYPNTYLLFFSIILVILVSVSRVILKKHTVWQVIAGVILSLICTLGILLL